MLSTQGLASASARHPWRTIGAWTAVFVLAIVGIVDEDETEAIVETVERADENPSFSVAVTGDETLDHDFNLLSQEDLENGELRFGLPAALIVLLLVFGAVVAGPPPPPLAAGPRCRCPRA